MQYLTNDYIAYYIPNSYIPLTRNVFDFYGQQYRRLVTRDEKTQHQNGRMRDLFYQLLVGNTRHCCRRLGVDHVKRVSNIYSRQLIFFFNKLLLLFFPHRNNVSYSSTCNGVGLALGICIGSICPILLTSEEFCNTYLRTSPETGGIMTFTSGYMLII